LEEEGFIVKGPGQGAPIHVSPAGDVVLADAMEGPVSHISITPSGAGYGDVETNRLIELAAMHLVISTYAADGWDIEDVSDAKCGWVITVRRDASEMHLEVRGVSGPRPSILLTCNEYDTACSDPLWRLAVATRALVAPSQAEYDRATAQGASMPQLFRVDLTSSTPCAAGSD